MSAEQLQSALMRLVRYPEAFRGNQLESFLSDFELTDKEKWQVRSLASSHYVQKFGKEQRSNRFNTSVRQAIPLSVKAMGSLVAGRKLFSHRFELEHLSLGVADIGKAYVDFFLANWKELQKKHDLADWVRDLVSFEFMEFSVFGPLMAETWRVSSESLLQPGAPFGIVDLEYDITAFTEEAKKLGPDAEESAIQAMAIEKRANTVLFVKVPTPNEPGNSVGHQFEIDADLKRFLQNQISDTPSKEDLPPCYADLVELGLCKPLA